MPSLRKLTAALMRLWLSSAITMILTPDPLYSAYLRDREASRRHWTGPINTMPAIIPISSQALGGSNGVIAMTTVANWEDACQHLATVETLWSDIPVLAFVEGTINCAMLLPRERRGTALGQIPLYMGVGTSHGSQATHHHARATVCFDYFSSVLPDSVDQHLTKSIAYWRLWLRLLDPNTSKAKAVRSEIQQRMDDGPTAVELMLFATVFDIPFDTPTGKPALGSQKAIWRPQY